jgi:RimJ/RimL family protein N-acetyltransferase
MRARQLDTVEAFLDEAEPLLLADEARHNLMLGVAATLRSQPRLYATAHFWIVRDESGTVVGAAQETPPFNVILAQPAADGVLETLVAATPDVPGVTAAVPEVVAFAELWCAAHGGAPRVDVEQGVYALDAVARVPRASGGMRPAGERERALLEEWLVDFQREALPHEPPDPERLRRLVEQRLNEPEGGFFVWEDRREPVALAAAGSRTPNGIRIGPVYTPPELRGRGYATSLVADLSRLLLDRGIRFCFLYTDLANPTSNAIYERIGYVRVCESRQIAFVRRASSGAASSAEPSDGPGGA